LAYCGYNQQMSCLDHNPKTTVQLHTRCPRRNVRDFGRVFLMLNYTDITQNTYIQSSTVTEIMAIENVGFWGVHVLYAVRDAILVTAHARQRVITS